MALNPSVAPSGNFNLTNWKITLPVDSSGGISGTAVEVQNLLGYQRSPFFWTADDGAMVFRAAVNGATTSGSSYARSELREMNGTARAAWNLSTGGVMAATLEVDQAPVRFDGTMGKVVVGQIHGASDELVRLYWDANKLYFANDQSGSSNTENKFYFTNAAGAQPNVSLNEKFSYVIDAKGSSLEVSIYADGDVYRSVSSINSVWQSDSFYFKAGAYLGVNETQGTGYGQTSFYDLRFNHTDTALSPATLTTAVPVQPVSTVTAPIASGSVSTAPGTTITGTDDANTLTGTSGNDVIDAKRGNDIVRAGFGNDSISGGTGTDYLYGEAGADTLFGQDGWDHLFGGSGIDRLSGGAGGDKFTYTSITESNWMGHDTISDWSRAQGDKISLSAVDANIFSSGDQSFKFLGTGAFTGTAAQLRYFHADGNTYIEGDVNGDKIGDIVIMAIGAHSFASTDFLL